jgi:hypothetical protein
MLLGIFHFTRRALGSALFPEEIHLQCVICLIRTSQLHQCQIKGVPVLTFAYVAWNFSLYKEGLEVSFVS